MTKTPIERAAEAHYYADFGTNSRVDFYDDLDELEREQHRHKTRAVFASIDEDDVERILIGQWHEDQCMCRDFDGDDIETCVTRQESGTRFCPPVTWTIEQVKAALLTGGES